MCHRSAETHQLAKRKAQELDKIRAAFGLAQDVKEGQAFDRELQERLKAERIAEREAARTAKEKEEKKRAKAAKKAEKAAKKAAKKAVKEAKRAAALKEKVSNRFGHGRNLQLDLLKHAVSYRTATYLLWVELDCTAHVKFTTARISACMD